MQSICYCPAPAAVRRPDQRARSSRPPHPSRGRWSRMQSTADMFEPSPNLVHRLPTLITSSLGRCVSRLPLPLMSLNLPCAVRWVARDGRRCAGYGPRELRRVSSACGTVITLLLYKLTKVPFQSQLINFSLLLNFRHIN